MIIYYLFLKYIYATKIYYMIRLIYRGIKAMTVLTRYNDIFVVKSTY